MKNKLLTLAVSLLCGLSIAYSQKKLEYASAGETFNNGYIAYENQKYKDAYEHFMSVNKNDTAYFDSRFLAIICMSAEEDYEEVRNIADEALRFKGFNPYKARFLNEKGFAYLQSEDYQEALEVYNKAEQEFPTNSDILRNKAEALYQLDSVDLAVETIQRAIRFNPTSDDNHKKLATFCYQAGLHTKAALAQNMALYLVPSYENFMFLDDIYNRNYDGEIIPLNFREKEDFKKLDAIIKSESALGKENKTPDKLNMVFSKNNYIVFNQLVYKKSSKGFFNQNYIAFFKKVMEAEQFKYFTYWQCNGVSTPKIDKFKTKKKLKINEFVNWSYDEYLDLMNKRMIWNGTSYETNKLKHGGSYGILYEGKKKDDKIVGDYIGYSYLGFVDAVGTFSSNGEKTGTWTYYDDYGRKTVEQEYVKDEMDGLRTHYYSNGSAEESFTYSDRTVQGTYKVYYPFNKLAKEFELDDAGIKNGPYKVYYTSGALKQEGTYKDNNLDGKVTFYHIDGSISGTTEYSDGKFDGAFDSYYENGQLEVKGVYDNNEATGEWEYYHANGQLETKGSYENGYKKGTWIYYRADGSIESESTFGENGKKNGTYTEYNASGNKSSVYNYKNQELISYETYYNDGSVATSGKLSKGKITYTAKYQNGQIKVEGSRKNDERVGEWKWYNASGQLTGIENYNQDGLLDGETKYFYDNGDVKSVFNYEDGYLNGYTVEYHAISRKKALQGYYEYDQKVGEWRTYHKNGELEESKYYLEGEIVGLTDNYDVNGVLYTSDKYSEGWYIGGYVYDTTGSTSDSLSIVDGKYTGVYKDIFGKDWIKKSYDGNRAHGEYETYYPDGTVETKGRYNYGDRIGEWSWYFDDGSISCKGQYEYGYRTGEWNWYYKNGKISKTKVYENGSAVGKTYRYYDNGALQNEYNYVDGNLHGKDIFYDMKGNLQYVKYFEHGELVGYAYNGTNGKLVEMIEFTGADQTITAYFSNGKKSYEATYKNGQLEGKVTYYNFSGTIYSEDNYVQDELHGLRTVYYANGTKKYEINFKYGDRDGLYTSYHTNGKVKIKKNYILGRLYGSYTSYNYKGTLLKKTEYYNNRAME